MEKRTRFDGTEVTISEKISKLVSGKNSAYSESVLQKICMNLSFHYTLLFLRQVDELGLYGQRVYKLYEACDYDLLKTGDVIIRLFELMLNGGITQDDIIAVKEKEDFTQILNKLL